MQHCHINTTYLYIHPKTQPAAKFDLLHILLSYLCQKNMPIKLHIHPYIPHKYVSHVYTYVCPT